MLASVDGPAHLVAHSSGAIAAAIAALADPGRLRSVVLYEPPFPIGEPHPDAWVSAAETAVRRGASEDALVIALRDGIRFPQAVIDGMRADPAWPAQVAGAPSWIREARSVVSLVPGVDRFAALHTPTLLLLGRDTQPHHTVGRTRRSAGSW